MEAEATTAANGANASDVLVADTDVILVTLARRAAELSTNREMCEDLLSSVAGLQPLLERMLAGGYSAVTARTLVQYNRLLRAIQWFLDDHVRNGGLAQLAKHWSVKKRIKRFHVERAQMQSQLECIVLGASVEHHVQVAEVVENLTHMNERIEQQHEQILTTLQRMISDIDTTMASRVDDARRTVYEALADLKHEIKINAAEYSDSELSLMKQLFLAGCKAYSIPRRNLSLPIWYIPRSDIRFDRTNPFSTGNFHSLHYGTLDSGARVAIKIVNADPEDTTVRDRFVHEVTTLNLLREPHILPFFGANHVGAPLLYITGLAANGDYRSYLGSHPDHFWQLFLDAARGLAYLHNNKVVHGNLKCSNLLVLADGTGAVADFMLDFVRASSELNLKTKPTVYDWTAPECLGVGEDANPRFESDVYSLGLCMIEAITGRRPFHGVNLSGEAIRDQIRDGRLPSWEEIPPGVASLVAQMCVRVYSKRAKLREVIRILEVLAAQERIAREVSSEATKGATSSRSNLHQRQLQEEPEWEFL